MDNHHQQPNVRRRLNFDDMDPQQGEHDDPMHGEGGIGNKPLPRLPGTGERDDYQCSQETDTESPPGSPARNPMGGIRILYQGYDRPRQVTRPRPGMATIIARDHDGLTTIYHLPLGQVQLALEDREGSETETDSDGDENDD